MSIPLDEARERTYTESPESGGDVRRSREEKRHLDVESSTRKYDCEKLVSTARSREGQERTGKEVGKGVRRASSASEEDGRCPSLPVSQVLSDLGESHRVGDGISSVQLDSLHDEGGLLLGKEGVLVGEIDDEEEADDGEEDGEGTEEHEDPLPSGESTLSSEKGHSI